MKVQLFWVRFADRPDRPWAEVPPFSVYYLDFAEALKVVSESNPTWTEIRGKPAGGHRVIHFTRDGWSLEVEAEDAP